MLLRLLKYSLSAPMLAGVGDLKRLGLMPEGAAHMGLEDYKPFSEIMVSGHGPYLKNGVRWNVAAIDDKFRNESIKEMLDYVDMVRHIPNLKQVNLHFPAKRWKDAAQLDGHYGTYDRMVEAFRQIADAADKHGIEIVLENGNAHWTGISDDVAADQVDWSDRNWSFGAAPEEWTGICVDIDRPNVGLCLDSSHLATYSHTIADEDLRRRTALSFLDKPELIRHVHWNDNFLYEMKGRTDQHALLGKGTLPVEIHRGIKKLDATLHLEHFYSTGELEEELEYIDGL